MVEIILGGLGFVVASLLSGVALYSLMVSLAYILQTVFTGCSFLGRKCNSLWSGLWVKKQVFGKDVFLNGERVDIAPLSSLSARSETQSIPPVWETKDGVPRATTDGSAYWGQVYEAYDKYGVDYYKYLGPKSPEVVRIPFRYIRGSGGSISGNSDIGYLTNGITVSTTDECTVTYDSGVSYTGQSSMRENT